MSFLLWHRQSSGVHGGDLYMFGRPGGWKNLSVCRLWLVRKNLSVRPVVVNLEKPSFLSVEVRLVAFPYRTFRHEKEPASHEMAGDQLE